MEQIEQPLTIFLIGATGDLSKKKILKALYKLYDSDLLPNQFTIVGVARRQMSREEFQEFVKEVVANDDSAETKKEWSGFAERLNYISGDVAEIATFEALQNFHSELMHCGNHLWYVATLPRLYESVVANIKSLGLQTTDCGWTKLLLEKPFGTDLATAQNLNKQLLEVFTEDQVFRIDHFLAKETVQNLLLFRFANGMFEHLWSNQYIDHIQVTSSESIGIAGRETFYDATGALRDVVQNHVLQMIATTLMEEPASLDADQVRQQRMELLSALKLSEDTNQAVALGQYSAGKVGGKQVNGYTQEDEKLAQSKTETAVAIKCSVDNERWAGVPIYLRAGKRMAADVTEISIVFKEPQNKMIEQSHQLGNILTFRIQPNEGVIIRAKVKKPGLKLELEEVPLQFCYQDVFQMGLVEAYVKLIYDAVGGDPTFFPRADGIEAAWTFVQPILDLIAAQTEVATYPAGSWGPASFNDLIAQDGRDWIVPSADFCQLPQHQHTPKETT
jgi:glucose-6-phosphate 1-dehydrogenase